MATTTKFLVSLFLFLSTFSHGAVAKTKAPKVLLQEHKKEVQAFDSYLRNFSYMVIGQTLSYGGKAPQAQVFAMGYVADQAWSDYFKVHYVSWKAFAAKHGLSAEITAEWIQVVKKAAKLRQSIVVRQWHDLNKCAYLGLNCQKTQLNFLKAQALAWSTFNAELKKGWEQFSKKLEEDWKIYQQDLTALSQSTAKSYEAQWKHFSCSLDSKWLAFEAVLLKKWDEFEAETEAKWKKFSLKVDAEFEAKSKQMDDEFDAKSKQMDDEFDAKSKKMDAEFEAQVKAMDAKQKAWDKEQDKKAKVWSKGVGPNRIMVKTKEIQVYKSSVKGAYLKIFSETEAHILLNN